MNSIKFLPMNFLRGISLLCLLCFAVSTFAQDATATSLYNKGLASLKAKDYENGYTQIEEALKAAEAEGNEKVMSIAKKNGAKAAYNLGSAKLKAKAIDEANTLFTRGLEMNPAYSSNIMGLAQVLDAKGEKVAAVKKYFEAIDLAKKNGKEKTATSMTKRAAGVISKLYKAKDYTQLVEAGKAYLAFDDNSRVNYYVAKSYEKQKDNASAVPFINKAVELAAATGKPVKDSYLWAQGNILEAAGNKADAKAAYQKITGEKYKANADFRIKELEK